MTQTGLTTYDVQVNVWVESTTDQVKCGMFGHILQSHFVELCVKCRAGRRKTGEIVAEIHMRQVCRHDWECVENTCSSCGARMRR